MKEFSETPSSKLSIEEFENVDLGEEEDPPAFKALKIKNKSREVCSGKKPDVMINVKSADSLMDIIGVLLILILITFI